MLTIDTTAPEAHLNEGQGHCFLEARVDLDLSEMAAEMGATQDFFRTLLHAVHDVNRNDPDNGRIAVAFPGLRPEARGLYAFGERVRLFGTEKMLARLIATDRVTSAVRRGLVGRRPRIFGVSVTDGAPGTAFVRARAGDRRTPGELRRRIARNARQGRDTAKLERKLAETTLGRVARAEADALYLPLGPKRLTFQPMPCPTAAQVAVSTYGFSNASDPAGLPVRLAADRDG